MKNLALLADKFIPYFVKTAHLEGEETSSGVIDGLNSDIIIANWYKIVLVAVAVGCIAGLIYSNIIRKK